MSVLNRLYSSTCFPFTYSRGWKAVRVQLKRDGTRRTGGEVKGKVANGVGNQYPSLPWNLVYPALLTADAHTTPASS